MQKILVDKYFKNQQVYFKNDFFEMNDSIYFKNHNIKQNLNEKINNNQNKIPIKASISSNFNTGNFPNRNFINYNGNLESQVHNLDENNRIDNFRYCNNSNFYNLYITNNHNQYFNEGSYQQKSSKIEKSDYLDHHYLNLNSTNNYNFINDFNHLYIEKLISEEKITESNYYKQQNSGFLAKNNIIDFSYLFNQESDNKNYQENSKSTFNNNCNSKYFYQNFNLRNQSHQINNKNMFYLMNNYHNFNNLAEQFTSKQIIENNFDRKDFNFKNYGSDFKIKKNYNNNFEYDEKTFDKIPYLTNRENNIEKNEETLTDKKISNLNLLSKNFKEELIISQDINNIEIISLKSDNSSELSVNNSFENSDKKFYENYSDSTKIEESPINQTPDNSIYLRKNADNKILYSSNSVNRLEAELLTNNGKNN